MALSHGKGKDEDVGDDCRHTTPSPPPPRPTSSPPSFSSSSLPAAVLPGLPDELATLCLARVPSLCSIWRVCKSWRRLLSQSLLFHTVRSELGLHSQQWLYVLLRTPSNGSGSFAWHAFDPLHTCWHPLPVLPDSVDFHLSSPSFIGLTHPVQCASSATKLFMVAGCKLSLATPEPPSYHGFSVEPALDCPLIFDTLSKQWSKGSPFRVPRRWCACGFAAGKLYVASGCGKLWDVSVSKSVECYDPDSHTWTTLEGLRSSKFSGEAITVVNYQGGLHMVSGKGVFRKVGAVYNPVTGKWSEMPRGMRGGWAGSCIVVDGRLLAVDESKGRLKAYDAVEDRWLMAIKHEKLKDLEEVIAGPGRICGIVRASVGGGGGGGQQDLIRVVRLGGGELSFTDVLPPVKNAKVVALQLLASMLVGEETEQ